MRLSIRVRTILALNVFVLGLTLILGWIAQEVAGQVVEERFAKEMAAGVSGFLKTKQFPLNDTMMAYLREMFHADWAASRDTVTNVVASSLPADITREFRRQVGGFDKPGVIRLGGQLYQLDWADVPVQNQPTGEASSYRLFMLVPYAQFQEARAKASSGVLKVMLPSAAVATVLAVLLAFSITRPIRKLAGEMDRLATDDSELTICHNSTDGWHPQARSLSLEGAFPVTQDTLKREQQRPRLRVPPAKGPREIVRLAASFHRLLDRLAAARQRLAQHERLATLGKVSLSVAHELRNPLSGIKMHARLLQDLLPKSESSGDKPDASATIEVMLREIERMELYLDELMSLSVSGDPAGRSLRLEPAKLSEIADGVLAILAGKCRHAKVAVVREYPADEPRLSADSGQLRQVMMNLMVNAIQAMPAGGTLTVRVCSMGILPMSSSFPAVSSSSSEQQQQKQQQQRHGQDAHATHGRDAHATVLFQVSDTGKGVVQQGGDIFEAFVSDKPNGVGLGLYLCKQIITRHGGNIGYDSSPSGATFWFELPIAGTAT